MERIAASKSASTADLATYPDAPAASAARRYEGSSCMVRTSTRVCGHACRRRSRVLRPPPPGMVRSSVSTSGLASRAWRKASYPSAASPTTSMSGWGLMSIRSPARTMAWSSTIRTRIFAMVLLLEGDVHVDRGSASRPRLERDGAVQKRDPFADVEQAQTNACARRLEQGIAVEPTSVVFHREMDARRVAPDHETDRLGRRVLQDIRERLLGDAVQSRLHFRRQTGRGQVRGDYIDRAAVGVGVIGR